MMIYIYICKERFLLKKSEKRNVVMVEKKRKELGIDKQIKIG